ncbi:oligosaccharide flippase family protein [Empedobacter falsenii]
MESYKKKIKLNVLSGYLNLFISSFIMLLISPLLVKFLGNVDFGIWKSIQRILSITSVADGRSTHALKSFISNLESDNDLDKKKRLIGSALKVSFFFMPLTVIVIIGVIYFLPTFINDIPTEYINTVRLTGFILGLNIILTPILSIPDSILIGTNNIYKLTNVQTLTTILMNVLFVISSYLGYGILGLGIISTFILILNGLLIYLICKRNVPWFGIKKPKDYEIKSFFKYSFWVFIWVFVERLFLSTEIFLIGYLLNPTEVTNYSFSSYMIQLGIPIALLTGSAFIPSIGKFIGNNDFENAQNIIIKLKKLLKIIALIFGVGIILFNQLFIQIWVGDSFYLGDFNNFLMVIIMVQLLLFRNDSQIQDQTLNIKNKVLVGLLGTLLVYILAVVAFKYYPNLSTIFISIILGRIIISIMFRIQVNKFLKSKIEFNDELFIFFIIISTYLISNYIFHKNIFLNIGLFLLLIGGIFKFLEGRELVNVLLKRK